MNILEPVVIFGAGMMGTAIALEHVQRGIRVYLYDPSHDALKKAQERVNRQVDASLQDLLVIFRDELRFLLPFPILIETIPEKLRAKQKLYKEIETTCGDFSRPMPYLFTNTSTISITKLADCLSPAWRKRFCGFHVFHPVHKNSLLEIIPGAETAPETIGVAYYHACCIDKEPIVVADGPGFLVNRILNPYLTEALKLLESGVDMMRIERIATDFGMRMGPFRIMDEIGLDVVLHAGWVLFKAFPDRVPESPLLTELVRKGRLGRKSGRGFMIYPNQNAWDGDGRPDPEFFFPASADTLSDWEIEHRLFLSMYEEALRCRDDGIITALADADLASTKALGFPLEKGGIVQWGRQTEDLS